jgi:hypothetical protein
MQSLLGKAELIIKWLKISSRRKPAASPCKQTTLEEEAVPTPSTYLQNGWKVHLPAGPEDWVHVPPARSLLKKTQSKCSNE